ncbi:MAG: DnaJ domain-containing protein [Deltaproteobacteria bacterium]|nr:DnaJ domain-containing protein [Deltaproteobacteria bacterium]
MATLGTKSPQIPRLNRDVDIYSLPIKSIEAFVLSRIDGVTSIADISFLCGISIEETEGVVTRLIELGAVSWVGQPRTTSNRAKTEIDSGELKRDKPIGRKPIPIVGAKERASSVRVFQGDRKSDLETDRDNPKPASIETTAASTEPDILAHPDRLSELEEDVELSLERRRQILEAFYRIEKQNHYQVLGISADADRNEIRSAYFELSKIFHTDSVFGKRLGGYKAKMEAIFKRITQAYEVLGKKKKRQEYDEYLAVTAQTREAEQILARTTDRPVSAKNGVISVVPERITINDSTAKYASTVEKSGPSSRPPESQNEKTEARKTSFRPSLTPEERQSRMQKVLRLRLSTVSEQSSIPPSRISQPSVPPTTEEERKSQRDSLIRNLARSLEAASKVSGGRDRVSKLLIEAKEAEGKGDLVNAASLLQLALSLASNRNEIKAEYLRVQSLVAAGFADKFEKQALYEEKEGKWKAAAQSWSRVCEGRPADARCATNAAEAFLKASSDMRKALKFAQKAVDIEPRNLSCLLVLARVYLAIGLKLNAKRELEKAVKLDPGNKMVKDLFKEVR